VETGGFILPWQEKVAWFWDDNLLVQRRWAKDLLRALRGAHRFWLTQASLDICDDRELLDLMEASGCAGIFLGIESFDAAALRSIDKRQNQVDRYRDAVRALHDRGICVMAGFIAGFDEQTPASIGEMADRLQELEFDVPFLSVLTPFRGTLLYDQLLGAERLLPEVDWNHYSGYDVAFRPARMTAAELREAHRMLWSRAFSPAFVSARLARAARTLSPGGLLLSAAMNGFYGWKRLTGNLPADAEPPRGTITHPPADAPPVRLRVPRTAA
jgi:radical SAM superfamily enzyme YgiQ (UPF0313 family)